MNGPHMITEVVVPPEIGGGASDTGAGPRRGSVAEVVPDPLEELPSCGGIYEPLAGDLLQPRGVLDFPK